MKRFTTPFIILILVVSVLAASPKAALAYSGYPTTSIVSVVPGEDVTVKVFNLPANIDFRVLIGKYGTLGVGGTQVATFDSGAGGTQTFTYDIPDALSGEAKLAIRFEATEGVRYFAYDWFVNTGSGGSSPTPPPPSSGYSGIPTFSILEVVKGETVKIKTNNLPKNVDFRITMGKYGTKGIGGTEVAVTNSGDGGSQSFTYDIPDALKGEERIAIRMEATSGTKYFAFNWFWNNTASGSSSGGSSSGGSSGTSGYTGFPTFSITAVVKNEDVTIKTNNLPKDTDFRVTMGKYGTQGVGGIEVAVTNSGDGGSQTFTYDIPEALKGETRIAIRLTATSGTKYFAYNWFWNNNAP